MSHVVAGRIRTRLPAINGRGARSRSDHAHPVQIWPDSPRAMRGSFPCPQRRGAQSQGELVLAKVFPIKLKDGMQAKAEAIVQDFAPKGPAVEEGTLSFRVYRDPAN